ncbi:YwiC-like family protein [uncultured Propionibacterium sp.]|uniref:YwiC-like family protein n=1 Tax=uncultured Propionibacterium sp. TaxID=218066 RepID=UPI00292F8D1F|nr:YwiC-like family protein [uncultured Propionibacterium sp.]
MARSKNWKKRWLPNQHGAWAMLIVPFVVGALSRQRAAGLPPWWIPLAVMWIIGYCLFAQTVSWVKMPAGRRPGLRAPITAYLVVCALCGVVVLALHGWALAIWLIGFAPLIAVAFALVRNHEERSVTSGMTTVAAACLMFYVLRCGGWPLLDPGLHDGLTGLLLYGYFAGTVFHVKSFIREKDSPAAARNSACWHAAWLAAAVLVCGPWLGLGSAWWIVFFAVALARTTIMKRMQNSGFPFRAGTLGVVEIILSAASIACSLA